MTGSRGLVFRPTTAPTWCAINNQHQDAMTWQERPPAAYLMFIADCLSSHCEGQLWCNGHAVCIQCGIGVREGRLVYASRPETPEIAAVTSVPLTTGSCVSRTNTVAPASITYEDTP